MRRFVAASVIAAVVGLLSPAVDAQAAVLCDISGSLVDATGVGVPGVGLRFQNDNGSVTEPTNADGGFAFAATCGAAVLQISWRAAPAAGLPKIATLRGDVQVTDGGRYALRLPPAVTASVTVTDGDHGGVPVVGALVYQTNEDNLYAVDAAPVLSGSPAFDAWTEVDNQFTDSTGKARFLTFPDHDMAMSVRPPTGSKLVDTRVVLDASTNVTRKVVLSETPPDKVALTGVVRDSAGRPLPGLLVALPGTPDPYVSTDATGAFKIWGAPGATHLAGWTDRAYPQAQLTPDVPFDFSFYLPLTLTATSDPVEITLPPVAHVRIRLTGPDGYPAWAALTTPPLSAFPSAPAVVAPGTAPASLSVDLQTGFLAYGGEIAFNVFPLPSVKGLKLRWDNADGDTQYLALGALDLRADRVIDVQLPPAPVKHVVSGTFTDSEGRPVTGLRIRWNLRYATTDSRGRFSLAVPVGHTPLTVERWSSNAGWVRTDSMPDNFWMEWHLDVAGPTTVALRLPQVHHVTVKAVDPVRHEPVKGALLLDSNYDYLALSGLHIAGASGTATGSMNVSAPATDADGVTVFRTFALSAADVELHGRYAKVDLISQIVDLEVTGDKRLDLVLGTSASPRTYRRPGTVSGLTATRVEVPGARTTTAGATSMGSAAAATMSATVRWTAPRRTGGMKIRGYRVTATPGGKSVRVGASARTATLTGLPRGTTYSFTVQAVNGVGPARGASARLDTAAPRTVLVGPTDLALGAAATVVWKGTDDASGVASYDVRVRSARADEPFGPYTRLLSDTRATSKSLSLGRGRTYCVSARARDRVGRVGYWSAPRCVSRPLDDAALTASPGWHRASGADYYAGTISRTAVEGAVLRVADVKARTLWVVATTCPACGTVTVRHAGVVVARLDLRSATTRHKVRLRIEEDAVRAGVVSVTASGPLGAVQIDGLAAQRAV